MCRHKGRTFTTPRMCVGRLGKIREPGEGRIFRSDSGQENEQGSCRALGPLQPSSRKWWLPAGADRPWEGSSSLTAFPPITVYHSPENLNQNWGTGSAFCRSESRTEI